MRSYLFIFVLLVPYSVSTLLRLKNGLFNEIMMFFLIQKKKNKITYYLCKKRNSLPGVGCKSKFKKQLSRQKSQAEALLKEIKNDAMPFSFE